jgi:hypothetical protein
MKSLALFKIRVILAGLAAALVLSPASKAQSEIAPDHFDGTDSWEAAAHRKVAWSKSQQERVATQANHRKVASRAALQLATKRQAATRPGHSTPAIPDRRKVLAQNSRKKDHAALTMGGNPLF